MKIKLFTLEMVNILEGKEKKILLLTESKNS